VVFGAIVVIVVAALGLRLFQLQIAMGGHYTELAQQQSVDSLAVPVSRGLIYDRKGRQLVENVPVFVVNVRPADLPFDTRDAVVARLAHLLKMAPADLYGAIDAHADSRFDLVKVATDVPTATAQIIAEEHLQLPGVYVDVEARRHYIYGELLGHILGWTGSISGPDYLSLKSDGYVLDDTIGKTGVEATFEKQLRGTYGVQQVQRDATGRVVRVLSTLTEPQPGDSLQLTIDVNVQRTAQQALQWAMNVVGLLRGVFIVMNPQTGEILAMVSLPNYNDNDFSGGISTKEYKQLLNAKARPLLNFAINEQFPPGSTYKLVTGAGALQDNKLQPNERLHTAAYISIGAYKYWDWNKAGFGNITIFDGFAHSSDTFFYQVAGRLGIDRLAYWAHQWGFGQLTGVDLPGEVSGTIPTNAWKEQTLGQPIYPGEVYQAGIGQGYDEVTPMQLIDAYNALANGGTLLRPQIVRRVLAPDGSVVQDFKPQVVRQLPISQSNLSVMRVAARNVLVSRHTYNFVDEPIVVAGKSGTAEFGLRDSQGRLPFHSWFVGFTPKDPWKHATDPNGWNAVKRTDAQLSFLAFAFDSNTTGNAATEIVKYFIQLYYHLHVDLRERYLLVQNNFYGN